MNEEKTNQWSPYLIFNAYYNALFYKETIGALSVHESKKYLRSLALDDNYFTQEQVVLNAEELDTIENKFSNSKLECYIDGSVRVDEDGEVFAAGGGLVIKNKYNKTIINKTFKIELDKYDCKLSSHIAEYDTLYNSLCYIKNMYHTTDYLSLLFYTDSKNMCDQLSLSSRIRNKVLKQLRDKINEEIASFKEVNIVYLPREENYHADKLAKQVSEHVLV